MPQPWCPGIPIHAHFTVRPYEVVQPQRVWLWSMWLHQAGCCFVQSHRVWLWDLAHTHTHSHSLWDNYPNTASWCSQLELKFIENLIRNSKKNYIKTSQVQNLIRAVFVPVWVRGCVCCVCACVRVHVWVWKVGLMRLIMRPGGPCEVLRLVR